MVKRTDTSGMGWYCYHRGLYEANKKFVRLESTMAAYSFNNNDFWGVSSTDFTVYGATTDTNINGATYVAYLFAHDDQSFGEDGDEAIIKCGSFTASTGSPHTVNVGFEPQWVIIKRTATNIGDWTILDNMRGWVADTSSDGTVRLLANLSYAEGGLANMSGLTSTGFTVDDNGITYGSNQSYIYIAIRRPHKPPSAGTDVFSAAATSASTGTKITTGFPVDLQITKYNRSTVNSPFIFTRLTEVSTTSAELGEGYLATSSTYGEFNATTLTRNWGNTGFEVPSLWGGDSSIYWNFRRAPGFFDVVAYTGDGTSNRQISHNLEATPEMMWSKRRDSNSPWTVLSSSFPSLTNNHMYLNEGNSSISTGAALSGWDSSSFTLGTYNTTHYNHSGGTHIAYLFASLSGISKVGTYTGTGSDLDIDCGFTAGARFVLIRRTDSTGGWYIWDSARGIVSGNDPYLLANSTAAEVTNTDYIDPLSAGFTVTSSAPAALNASGGSYIFFAIA